MVVADPLAIPVADAPALPAALRALKAKVHADLAEFRREVGWRLPSALEPMAGSEIRQHLGAFLEHTFRAWAERENEEVQQALSLLTAQAWVSNEAAAEPSAGPASRLQRPTFEVSTFASDASVVAALALGIGTVFANAAVGGLLLLAAPALASFGRERGERALRKRAAEAAMRSIDAAVLALGQELDRVIEDFARRIPPDLTAAH